MIFKKTALTMTIIMISSLIFSMGGTVPAGLPGYFGFGCIDKADSYAVDGPHFFKDLTPPSACWDYSYAYLTPNWTGWISGGGWAKQELQHWESKGQIQVFTFYYTPYTLSNYTTGSWMNTYLSDFKTLMQVCAANTTKVVIVHIEPDLMGYWQQAGKSPTTTGTVNMSGSGFNETDDGVNITSLPNTIQGWSEALYRIRNQYAKGKVLLAHHFTHWATNNDVYINSSGMNQSATNTQVDAITTFISGVENGHPYDLIFSDPSDRDADWYRIQGGGSNTRWTDPGLAYTDARSWGRIAYIINRASTTLARRFMIWQVPNGNTYFKTCNNTSGHYRDYSSQSFLPSTSANGSSGTPGDAYSSSSTTTGPGFYAQNGVIGVLFGEGGYDSNYSPHDMTHLRDALPGDGVYNPGSDNNAGSFSADTWGKQSSTLSDNDGGYIRTAVGAYCTKGKYYFNGSVSTPTFTFTRTPLPSATITPSFTRTNTPVPPTSTFTSTNIPATPTFTATPSATRTITPSFTRTDTPVPPTATFTFTQVPATPTLTSTSVPATPTYTYTTVPATATLISTAVPATATFTSTAVPATKTFTITLTATKTNTQIIPTATLTFTNVIPGSTVTDTPTITLTATRTNTPVPPTQTQTNLPTATATFTNVPANTATTGATKTFTPTPAAPTLTFTPTNIPQANTATPVVTQTQAATAVISATFTATATYTPTAGITLTVVPGATLTATATIAQTLVTDPIIYPNPSTNGRVTVRFYAKNDADNFRMLVYTRAYRLVRAININGTFKQGMNEIDLAGQYLQEYSKGIYYFRIILKQTKGAAEILKPGTFILL
jgi:hypothetical protein